jgi:hypothetical protein
MRHALGVILLLLAGTAQAIPVTWTVDGIFDDGGTLTGTFVFDADTGSYTNINLSSTDYSTYYEPYSTEYDAGTAQFGAELTYSDFTVWDASGLFVQGQARLAPSEYIGLDIFWGAALTNAGGTYSLVNGRGRTYTTNLSVDAGHGPIRAIASGTVSTVPIPAAVWLFGSALAGLGWMRRKQTV